MEVLEDEIIITLPFTNYTVTYYKPTFSPGLLAKNFPTKDDSRVPITQAAFLGSRLVDETMSGRLCRQPGDGISLGGEQPPLWL